jgi:flagellar hook-associated protein 2
MAQITSAGLGSGLDVNSLVSQLVAAEGQPRTVRLDRQEAEIQAQLSAFGSLKGAISAFQGSLASLLTTTSSSKSAVSGDSSIFAASATTTASAGNYSIEISMLARAHALASGVFTNTTTAVGTGKLTISLGEFDGSGFTANAERKTVEIDITSSNNTLAGIEKAINDADAGVTASIVNDGTGYRLTLISDYSGTHNSIKLTVSGDSGGTDTDTTGLSQLAYDPAAAVNNGKNISQTQAAVDAALTINGLSVSSDSNVLTSAIDGVTLTLKKTTSGTPVSLTVSEDKGTLQSSISKFVGEFNKLFSTIDNLSGYDAETKQAGILIGDYTVRSVESRMRQAIGSTITGTSGTYTGLATVGITTQKDGALKLDSAKLEAAIAADPTAVQRLFSQVGTASNDAVRVAGFTNSTAVGSYAVNVTQAATRGQYAGATDSISLPVSVTGGSNTFTLQLDGTQSGTITITPSNYTTGEALAAEIQSRINGDAALTAKGIGVIVNYVVDTTGGHLEIVSNTWGAISKVEIVADNTAGLGLTGGTKTTGTDVAGTIGGITASGSGRKLTGAGVVAGLALEIPGDTSGDLGIVDFTRGISYTLDQLAGQFLNSDGIIEARTGGLTGRVNEISEQREVLARRLEQIEARYRKQFSALDALVGQLQTTSNFLTQQLANLPGVTQKK